MHNLGATDTGHESSDEEIAMTDTLLVGVDGSDSSRRAADFAAVRAKAGGARVVVAHVIEWSPYSFNTPEENEQRHQRREEEIARAEAQIIAPVVAELQGGGLEVEGVVRHGHAAQVICDLAGEFGAAQLFIARRGQSKIAALLFGSVAGSLVQISPVPVTVVP
jgi:nucleotide-binding universal stress UspA family protein